MAKWKEGTDPFSPGGEKDPLRKCYTCEEEEFDSRCLELNDHFFCCLICKIAQRKVEDEALMQSRTAQLYKGEGT